jgi:hypothetical protein
METGRAAPSAALPLRPEHMPRSFRSARAEAPISGQDLLRHNKIREWQYETQRKSRREVSFNRPLQIRGYTRCWPLQRHQKTSTSLLVRAVVLQPAQGRENRECDLQVHGVAFEGALQEFLGLTYAIADRVGMDL